MVNKNTLKNKTTEKDETRNIDGKISKKHGNKERRHFENYHVPRSDVHILSRTRYLAGNYYFQRKHCLAITHYFDFDCTPHIEPTFSHFAQSRAGVGGGGRGVSAMGALPRSVPADVRRS